MTLQIYNVVMQHLSHIKAVQSVSTDYEIVVHKLVVCTKKLHGILKIGLRRLIKTLLKIYVYV